MAWKSKYPNYPDLTDPCVLGDVRARLFDRDKPDWSGDAPNYEQHLQHLEDCHLRWASMLMHFVNCVEAGESVEPRLLEEFSSAFTQVLKGAAWEDAIPLPEREFKEEWGDESPKVQRDKRLSGEVEESVRLRGDKVTEAIASVAAENHLSFETVRAAYYKWRSLHVQNNEGRSNL